jgi:hypothetical protein
MERFINGFLDLIIWFLSRFGKTDAFFGAMGSCSLLGLCLLLDI